MPEMPETLPETLEIRALAERVLFGRTLEDKLLRPERLTDARPGPPIALPDAPGRPPGLDPTRRARVPFPSLGALDRPEIRGQVLHRFANHELMAIELMALALLRFPDAPAAFRRGVVGALFEEQDHFTLYRERMASLGCHLGEVPSSPLFWDLLAPMASPLDYVVGMSLTFEQANLDFARHYRGVFADIGDAETAAVLDRVYEDEIGHVKLGLVWFRRWLSPADDWMAYCDALPEGLQPSRAKGIGFDAEGRRRAGFDEGFIRRLRVFEQSKGRVPALHVFNPTAELELTGRALPAAARQLARDLETLPMFLCARDDAVRVERAPRPDFLAPLRAAGFVLPEFATADDLAGRRLSGVQPWAAIPGVCDREDYVPTPPALFGKGWALERRRALIAEGAPCPLDPAIEGTVCPDARAVEAAVAALRAGGATAILGKPVLGTAGVGQQPLDDGIPRRWLDRALAAGPVIVERRLDRVLDLGVQLTVDEAGARIDAITRNLVDGRGRFRGVALVTLASGLPVALRAWLMSDPVHATLRLAGHRVGAALAAAGHRGPACVDALVYRDAAGFGLQPIVEVNPRASMGRVALALRRRIARGSSAAWLHLPAATLRDDPEWAPGVALRGDPPLITGGVLHTTDPRGARFGTALVVTGRFADLQARLRGRIATVDPAFG